MGVPLREPADKYELQASGLNQTHVLSALAQLTQFFVKEFLPIRSPIRIVPQKLVHSSR